MFLGLCICGILSDCLHEAARDLDGLGVVVGLCSIEASFVDTPFMRCLCSVRIWLSVLGFVLGRHDHVKILTWFRYTRITLQKYSITTTLTLSVNNTSEV